MIQSNANRQRLRFFRTWSQFRLIALIDARHRVQTAALSDQLSSVLTAFASMSHTLEHLTERQVDMEEVMLRLSTDKADAKLLRADSFRTHRFSWTKGPFRAQSSNTLAVATSRAEGDSQMSVRRATRTVSGKCLCCPCCVCGPNDTTRTVHSCVRNTADATGHTSSTAASSTRTPTVRF